MNMHSKNAHCWTNSKALSRCRKHRGKTETMDINRHDRLFSCLGIRTLMKYVTDVTSGAEIT